MRELLLVVVALIVGSAANAANWTTDPAGGSVCTGVQPGQICYNVPAGVTTPALSFRCKSATLIVFGAAASVVPQACATAACTLTAPLFSAPLTGDSPNAWGAINTPFPFIRATDDNTGVTLALVCM